MKKIIIILTLVGFCFGSVIFAQSEEAECKFVADKEYLKEWADADSYKNKRLSFVRENWKGTNVYDWMSVDYLDGIFKAQLAEQGGRQDVNIVAHIIRKSNGTGGLSQSVLDAAIVRLNNFFVGFRIEFQLCEINYIDDDKLFIDKFSGDSADILDVTNRNRKGKLNIYFNPNGGSWTWRPSNNPKRQHVMILNVQARNRSTLSHEVGHWFDLIHTQGNVNGNHPNPPELVDGSNCPNVADFVCDTPADPGLSGRITQNCFFDWKKTGKDKNGNYFWPDTRNMMSYSTKPCRSRFSFEQILRMQAAYLNIETDRGYKLESCSSPLQPKSPNSIHIKWNVNLIARTNDENGWAACLAMILNWRDGSHYNAIDIEKMAEDPHSQPILVASGIDLSLFFRNGLMVEPAITYTPQTFADMLSSGPVYITSHHPTFKFSPEAEEKMRVVVAMEGDGTPEGTMLTVYDPAPDNKGAIKNESFKKFVEYQEAFWITDSEAPGAVFMVHP